MMISEEEFDIMVEQLTRQKPASFEMLCSIVERTLHGWIYTECAKYEILKAKRLEEDIYHDVQIRLIQKTVTHFLLRNADAGINRDPVGFKSWMYAVAQNIIIDSAKKSAQCDLLEEGDEENLVSDADENDTPFPQKTATCYAHGGSDDADGIINPFLHKELLRHAVEIVVESGSRPHIVLTWLAMCVYMVTFDMTKIESNHEIKEVFFSKSLNEMYAMLLDAMQRIPWLVLTEKQHEKMKKSLDRKINEKTTFGEMLYRDFLREREPLSSISDWENRMNNLIKRVKEK